MIAYRCVGGPHDGEWHNLDPICYRILLRKSKLSVEDSYQPVFPSLENIKIQFDAIIEKTTYILKDGTLVPE
jgi:hypothetical protein